MLAMERCSRAAAVRSASLRFGSMRKVSVVVLAVAIAPSQWVCWECTAMYSKVPYNPSHWEGTHGPALLHQGFLPAQPLHFSVWNGILASFSEQQGQRLDEPLKGMLYS